MIWDEFGCTTPSNLRMPECAQYVGLECEIEGIRDHGNADDIGWQITNDGSLRNQGFEYISKPITIPKASEMFQRLHGSISFLNPDKIDPFSQRTSIHVHANCANLSMQVTRNIVLLYALFEEAFFLMCTPERRDNIHCTPLTETHLPSIYNTTLANMVSKWHKYTALNLKPISKQGTIEFRHMQGHADKALLDEWLTIIANLFLTGKEVSVDADMFTEENLFAIYTKIFGQSRLRDQYELVRGLMANQILDVKLAVI